MEYLEFVVYNRATHEEFGPYDTVLEAEAALKRLIEKAVSLGLTIEEAQGTYSLEIDQKES